VSIDPPTGFLAPFRYRAFRLLWTGAFLSSIGTWTQDVALSWLIHTRFLDPRYLGFRSFAADAPLLAFMLVGGAAADRVDRRRILLTSQLVQMAAAAALGVLYASGRLGVVPILLLAFLAGLAQSQSAPTYQAVITTLVPAQQIPNAVALNSFQFNLSRVIGPAFAGALLYYTSAGWCFSANAVSFLAVIVALWRIEIPSPRSGGSESLRESLMVGFRHVRGSPVLRALMALAGLASFLAFPLITYLPVIATDVLRAEAAGYSLLLLSFGVGAIVGAVVTAHRGQVAGRGRVMLAALTAYGAAVLLAVYSPWRALTLLLLAVAGFFLVCGFSIVNSLVQENAPETLRGRIVSIYGLAFRGGMPLGSVSAGFLVKLLGAPATLGGFSVLLALITATVYVRGGRLRSL
jgi:MFS family permease